MNATPTCRFGHGDLQLTDVRPLTDGGSICTYMCQFEECHQSIAQWQSDRPRLPMLKPWEKTS